MFSNRRSSLKPSVWVIDSSSSEISWSALAGSADSSAMRFCASLGSAIGWSTLPPNRLSAISLPARSLRDTGASPGSLRLYRFAIYVLLRETRWHCNRESANSSRGSPLSPPPQGGFPPPGDIQSRKYRQADREKES